MAIDPATVALGFQALRALGLGIQRVMQIMEDARTGKEPLPNDKIKLVLSETLKVQGNMDDELARVEAMENEGGPVNPPPVDEPGDGDASRDDDNASNEPGGDAPIDATPGENDAPAPGA